jgi:VanZ family protein
MNAPEERIHVSWPSAAALALAGVVFLSLGPEVHPGSELMDRLAHVAAYAVLTALLLLARDRRQAGPRLSILAIGVGLVAFGTAMELAQGAVHRDTDVVDVVADAFGAGAVLVTYSVLRARSDRGRNGGRRHAKAGGNRGCSVRRRS